MSICIVSGRLISINGRPLVGFAVAARPVSERDSPVFFGESVMSRDSVETITDTDGRFSMSLIRGINVVLTIDAINFSKRVFIPDQGSVDLKDL